MESEMKAGEQGSEVFGKLCPVLEEEALLQRFVQLKSELEEHQELQGPWKLEPPKAQSGSVSLMPSDRISRMRSRRLQELILGVSENCGLKASTLKRRILITRSPK